MSLRDIAQNSLDARAFSLIVLENVTLENKKLGNFINRGHSVQFRLSLLSCRQRGLLRPEKKLWRVFRKIEI